MQALIIILPLLSSPSLQTHYKGCLTHLEALSIATNWESIFNTDSRGYTFAAGKNLVSKTAAPNVELWDDGGYITSSVPPGPFGRIFKRKKEIQEPADHYGKYQTPVSTNGTHSVMFAWEACDWIAVRWRYDARAGRNDNVTVDVGTPVSYKGIDLLQVDLETRLIYNITTSQDLLNYYIQLGDTSLFKEGV